MLAKYVAVVEYRPIYSVNIVSQFQSSTFGHNSTLQRGLSAIAELLVYYVFANAFCHLRNKRILIDSQECGFSMRIVLFNCC